MGGTFKIILTVLLALFLCSIVVTCHDNINDEKIDDNSTVSSPSDEFENLVNSDADDEPLPELEPTVQWPSENHFSSDPSKWPGNGQPLGAESPVTAVDSLKSFPSRKLFIDDYLVPHTPVRIIDPLRDSSFAKNWPKDYFHTTNGFAALHYVNATLLDGQQEEMSLREYFVRKSWDKTIELETSVPDYLRLDFSIPVSLQCKAIVTELQEAKLRSIVAKKTRTISSSNLDRFSCVAKGTKKVFLVNVDQVFRDSNYSLNLSEDFEGLEFQAVDLEKFPALRFARFVTAELKSSDCFYVPSKWVQFQSTSENYLEVEINWVHRLTDSSDKSCGDLPTGVVSLGLVKFEKQADIDLHKILHAAPLQHFFNGVGSKNFTFEEMEQWLKRDKKVLQKMTEWNDEYSEITAELFLLLDLNRDSVFSAEDLDHLTRDKQSLFLGRLHDRMQDFTEIMNDQTDEKSGPKGAGTGLNAETKAYFDKYNQEMKKLIADAVAQMKDKEKVAEQTGQTTKQDVKEERIRPDKKPSKPRPDYRDAEIAENSDGNDSFGSFAQDVPEEILAEDLEEKTSINNNADGVPATTNKPQDPAPVAKKDPVLRPNDEL